jgi:methyl-accepting chemotaxis protein
VADEVRNLAMRAAEAARTTGEQIQGTTGKINSAMAIVTKSLETFSEVTENAVNVNTLVTEIAEATGEQALGIDQINKAVAEIEQVLQQNASGADGSAAASRQLSDQLQDMICDVMHLGDQLCLGKRMETLLPVEEDTARGKMASVPMAGKHLALDAQTVSDAFQF